MGGLFSPGQCLGPGLLRKETRGGNDARLCPQVPRPKTAQDRLPHDLGQKTVRRRVPCPQPTKTRLVGAPTLEQAHSPIQCITSMKNHFTRQRTTLLFNARCRGYSNPAVSGKPHMMFML